MGTESTRQNGLQAEVAEILVCNRALSSDEIKTTGTALQKRWGDLDSLGVPEALRAANGATAEVERVRWDKNRRRDIVIDQTAPGPDAATINADFSVRIKRFHPSVVVLSSADYMTTTEALSLALWH